MLEDEIKKFWYYVKEAETVFPDWRRGQAMMNALRVVAPPLYADISGTKYDVFYRDSSQDIYRFREYLGI